MRRLSSTRATPSRASTATTSPGSDAQPERGWPRIAREAEAAPAEGRGMQRVLVTGGAGFIGSHLVERLLAEGGHRVRVLDNFATGSRRNLDFARQAVAEGRCEILEGDLRDRSAVARAVADVEVVFHEAAMASVARSIAEPGLVDEVNVGGTLKLLEAARAAGVKRVV